MTHILFNPLAGNGTAGKTAEKLAARFDDAVLDDMIEVSRDYAGYFAGISGEDRVILCGGDGTLNRFINESEGIALPDDLLFYGAGTGNDFLHDLGKEPGCDPLPVAQYLKSLPFVTVKGKTCRFLNAIGYGIDGYCCEVGDQLKEKSDKPVNYAGIAIKGLLFHFKPTNAKITVDGKEYTFKKVWLAPTMHGRFYGGGMMTAPEQQRNNAEKLLSLVVMHGSGKLKTLIVFPSIFKGEHVKHTEMTTVLTGHNITVAFDRPVALQIDGETVLNVTEYSVQADL